MNVLVLGQSGFVGSNIGEVLTENGIPFTSASRRNGLDLRDYHQAAALLEKIEPEIIINCAAHVGSLNYVSNTAADVITDNSRMILAMYNAMAQVCPNAVVINPIANCAYPSQMEIFREKDWWNGSPHPSILAYAATRRLMWAVSESFLLQHGVKTISLLVPSMYGPFDSTDPNKAHVLNALISKFVKARINNDAEVEVWGTGIAVREWLFAKDFGRIVLDLLRDPHRQGFSEPVNVAQNHGLSVLELTSIIQAATHFEGSIYWDRGKPDGAHRRVMDDRRFRTKFPDFQFTSLSEGISATIEFYESIFPY